VKKRGKKAAVSSEKRDLEGLQNLKLEAFVLQTEVL